MRLRAYAGDGPLQPAVLSDVEPVRVIEAGRLVAALELLAALTVDGDRVALPGRRSPQRRLTDD